MVLAEARIREPTMTIPAPSQNSHQVGCGMKATPPTVNPTHTITVPIHEILRPLKCSPSCAAPATGCAAVPPGPSTVPVVARSATTHPPTIRYAHAAVMKNTPTFPGGTHQPPRPPDWCSLRPYSRPRRQGPGKPPGPAQLPGTAQVLARKLAAPRGKPRSLFPGIRPAALGAK